MGQPDDDRPLHQIETRWSEVYRAHLDGDGATEARARLVLCYIEAVRRYMTWSLRDRDAAAELAQEFAVRVLRGDFRRADQNRGRFRDFVRTAAANLIHDHHRRRKAGPASGAEGSEPVAPPGSADEPDAEFLRSWRMELFGRAMVALAAYQERTGRPYRDIIALRTEHPGHTSAELAALYSERSGKAVKEGWFRQNLRRARGCLADLLLDEVAASIGEPASFEELEQELIVLDLLGYCHESLRRRARGAGVTDPP